MASTLWTGQGRYHRSLTIIEVVVASAVLIVALPTLLDSWLAVVRADRSIQGSIHTTHVGQIIMEHIRYHLYNDDDRGYGLNESKQGSITAYSATPPSYFTVFSSLAEGERLVVTNGQDPSSQSRYLAEFFGQDNKSSDSGQGLQILWRGINRQTNPQLAEELQSHGTRVSIMHYLDDSDSAWPDGYSLADKRAEEPKVDLARINVTVHWQDARGQTRIDSLTTRVTRDLFEQDPTDSSKGR
jgi:hypothetical protein